MGLPLYTLLLLCCSAASVFSADLFIFDGLVTCKYDRNFNYHIFVFEDDPCTDDVIGKGEVQYKKRFSDRYNISAVDTDDGVFDHWYEVVLIVYHTCVHPENPNESLRARFDMGSFPIVHGTHLRTTTLDLTNNGKPWNKIVKHKNAAFPGCNEEADP